MPEIVSPADVFATLASAVTTGYDKVVNIGGATITVSIERDHSWSADGDSYTDADRAAYGKTWHYIGVKLSVEFGNISTEASLWGIDTGRYPGQDADLDTAGYLANDVLPALYREARGNLAAAVTALNELPI